LEVVIRVHASFVVERRGITEELIKFVVKNPQQKLPSKKGRVILQNKYYDQIEKKEMILRVVGIEGPEKFNVLTVYKTSKIGKYWMDGWSLE